MFISKRSVFAFALGAALLLGAGQLSAQGAGGGGAGGRAGGGGGGGRGGGAPLTPTTYRQQGIMQQFQTNMTVLTNIRNGTVGGGAADVLSRAIIIQELTKSLNGAFPANSAGEGSRALPAIWTDAAGFAARVQAIQTAANNLVTAARGTDAAAIGTAQMAVQQACGACHMAFRGPAPGN